jgi:hypothetical protein
MGIWNRILGVSAIAAAASLTAPSVWGQAPPAPPVIPAFVPAQTPSLPPPEVVMQSGAIAPPVLPLAVAKPTEPAAPAPTIIAPAAPPVIVPSELPAPAVPVVAPAIPATPVVPASTATPGLVPLTQPNASTITTNYIAPSTGSAVAITSSAPAPMTGMPSLAVKQILPDTLGPGQPVTIDVNVTNTGTRTAESVVLTGWWTEGYDISETSVAAYTINGRKAWGMGAIAAGESRGVKLKLTPSSTARPIEFRSGFDATFSSAVTDTRSVRVLKPEMKLSVTAPETILVGQPVNIGVKVTNCGQLELKQAKVEILLPEVVQHPNGSKLGTQIAEIAVGKDEMVPLNLTGARSGEGKVKVIVTAPGCEPQEQELRLNVVDAKLAITMHGPKTIYQNWPATYEAVIENQSSVPLKGTSIEVKLPTGLAELRASDKPGYDASSHRVVWSIDTLQPGEKRTVLWFGFAKQTDDLNTSATISIGGMPVKRTEWTTKNAGAEPK